MPPKNEERGALFVLDGRLADSNGDDIDTIITKATLGDQVKEAGAMARSGVNMQTPEDTSSSGFRKHDPTFKGYSPGGEEPFTPARWINPATIKALPRVRKALHRHAGDQRPQVRCQKPAERDGSNDRHRNKYKCETEAKLR